MRRNSILASVVLTLFVVGCGGPSVTEKVSVAQKGIKKLDKAIQEFSAKRGTYPSGLTVLVSEGLVEEADLCDPWDQEYQYDAQGTKHRGRKPDIWTAIPDQTRTLSN